MHYYWDTITQSIGSLIMYCYMPNFEGVGNGLIGILSVLYIKHLCQWISDILPLESKCKHRPG